MMRSSILGAFTMLNILIQHLPLQSLFWTKIWRDFSSLRSQHPLPSTNKDLRSFLWHVDFYRRFIQDFAKVSKPVTTLLCKDNDFIIDEEGKRAFTMLKQALIEAPILQISNWDLPFEIMCDASNYAVGVVLGQRLDKKPATICYASKTLIEAQINYTTMEKELLAVVYALEKFRPYILGSKIIIYTDHAALNTCSPRKRPNHD